ncbi:retrovirus-related pol polyprotein from transposon TNT 1-94 [Tanacetum coccineum]
MVMPYESEFSRSLYSNNLVTTLRVPATEDSLEVPAKTSVETILNMTPENKAHYESEKEAIHLILTGIGDEIYSTIDACQTAQEMWEAIERLQQGDLMLATRYERQKRISQTITPTSESASEEDSVPEQAQKGQYMQKNLDLSLQNNQTGQFGNQRAVNVVGARETVGGPVVQQSGIQCFNCKEFGHYAKNAESKTVRAIDLSSRTRMRNDEQELKHIYSYIGKIQEVPMQIQAI